MDGVEILAANAGRERDPFNLEMDLNGIECRDETIRLQDDCIKRLQSELAQAKAVILTYQRLAAEAQAALGPIMEQVNRSLPYGK